MSLSYPIALQLKGVFVNKLFPMTNSKKLA